MESECNPTICQSLTVFRQPSPWNPHFTGFPTSAPELIEQGLPQHEAERTVNLRTPGWSRPAYIYRHPNSRPLHDIGCLCWSSSLMGGRVYLPPKSVCSSAVEVSGLTGIFILRSEAACLMSAGNRSTQANKRMRCQVWLVWSLHCTITLQLPVSLRDTGMALHGCQVRLVCA
ncbi:hypothetical protein VTK26DRAFT_3220 [Humicola hyalothermophila]